MRILIAPNAFKNSLDATAVAMALQEGLQQSQLLCTTDIFPVADGGDGTVALLIKKLNGKLLNAMVHDPLGRKINASFGLTDNGETAIIEMAGASGLRLLKPSEYDPLHASSFGTGELIRFALDQNVKRIIIAIGGSATVDGGTGLLKALGIRFLDAAGNELTGMPGSLIDLARIDSSGLDKRIGGVELIVLCDVANTLLGTEGSAAVFGPQKGADETIVKKLDASLTCLRNIILQQTGTDIATLKQGGAAGGVAAGLAGLLNAKLVMGTKYFLLLTGFDAALQHTDLVITAEGSIDMQTLEGKAPFGVAQKAKEKKIPVIGVAGSVPLLNTMALHDYFDVLISINNEIVPLDIAIANTAANLVRTGRMIGDMMAIKKSSS
jgi:glycerate 2-kinase